MEYELNNWNEVIKYSLLALQIINHSKTYINEIFCWDETVYDLLSISYYYLGKYDEALKYILKAIEINPNNERLKRNYELINEKI